jgi:hypothetical protein
MMGSYELGSADDLLHNTCYLRGIGRDSILVADCVGSLQLQEGTFHHHNKVVGRLFHRLMLREGIRHIAQDDVVGEYLTLMRGIFVLGIFVFRLTRVLVGCVLIPCCDHLARRFRWVFPGTSFQCKIGTSLSG